MKSWVGQTSQCEFCSWASPLWAMFAEVEVWLLTFFVVGIANRSQCVFGCLLWPLARKMMRSAWCKSCPAHHVRKAKIHELDKLLFSCRFGAEKVHFLGNRDHLTLPRWCFSRWQSLLWWVVLAIFHLKGSVELFFFIPCCFIVEKLRHELTTTHRT